MHATNIRLGRLVRASLIAGMLAGCGGSGATEPATPAAGEPPGEKHQCKSGHGCSGMDMEKQGEAAEGAAGAAPHVPE